MATDAGRLSDKTFDTLTADGRQVQLASDQEKYYMHLTKAQFELRDYKICIATIDQAVKEIEAFHYHNDIWFARRKALCLSGLGQIDAALDIMQKLFILKNDWFIEAEIAELLFRKGALSEALHHACHAASAKGDRDKKTGTIRLIAQILHRQGKSDECIMHLLILRKLQNEGKYRPNQIVTRLAEEYQSIILSDQTTLAELFHKAEKIWIGTTSSERKRVHGIIINILPGNKAGFIRADTGETYYFQARAFNGSATRIKSGIAVIFSLADGFDKKKNIVCKNAIDISPEQQY